jgi:EmrB/QacA subfamily drug resistance transporter
MVLLALILSMALAAIEGTIVATAMPSIAAALGGFALYGWVFSGYLLTQAVTTPIFGKLADLYGRKPMMIAGILLFLAGSSLCGFASSMTMLIVFRIIQGIGAGGVLPIAVTLAGDLYTIEERGRVQGYVASVWGVSSIVGPLLGGLIVHSIGWRWIFWMNLPLGLLAVLFIVRCLYEEVEHRKRSIDFGGAAFLLVGLSACMLALTQAGAWNVASVAALFVFGLAVLVAFAFYERKVPDPIVHLELFKIPLLRKGNLTILAAGLAMIGLISFLPTYVQAVLGYSALVAGFTLSGMSLGWPIASVVAGRLLTRWGVRLLVRIGCVAALFGTLIIALFAGYGPLAAGAGSFVVGIGFGFLNTTFLVAIQSSVSWTQRGVATASNMLMRSIGNALGAAVLGGVLNFTLTQYLEGKGLSNTVSLDSVKDLVAGHSSLNPSALILLREGLGGSIQILFWTIVGFTALTLLLGWSAPDLHPKSPAPESDSAMQVAVDSGLEPPGPEVS